MARSLVERAKAITIAESRQQRSDRYFRALCKIVTVEEFQKAAQAVLEVSQGGDHKAFKILASYVIGRPTIKVEAAVLPQIRATFKEKLDLIYGSR